MTRGISTEKRTVIPLRQEFDAVFEDGVLRPITTGVDLPEGVRLRVTTAVADARDLPLEDQRLRVAETIALLDQIADEMTEDDWKAIEEARLDQKHFFDRPKP